MPDWLDEEAQIEWKRVAPLLEKVRVLFDPDKAMLADYCAAHSLAVKATIAYQTEGLMQEKLFAEMYKGRKKDLSQTEKLHLLIGKKHPMIKVAQEARAQAMRLGAEFGLSPASRTRVSAVPEETPESAASKSEDFLFGPPKLVVG